MLILSLGALLGLFKIAHCQDFYTQTSITPSIQIQHLRDSLDGIQLEIPALPNIKGGWTVLKVKRQKDWDVVTTRMKALLDEGHRNILVRVIGKNIEFGRDNKVIQGWHYPDANIRIIADKAKWSPCGYSFSNKDDGAIREGDFYALVYNEFSINDIITDCKGNEISIREETKQVVDDIVQVQGDIWKFEINLPDLTEEQCGDFYVLMTRDWTSARHKVVKVQDGWLYYHLDSEDLHSERNPNVDWNQYHIRPRYTLINYPLSKGIHIANGRIYIPKRYKKIRVNKGGQFITFAYCTFNSLEISGLKLNGCGNSYSSIGVYSSTFNKGAFIHHNFFTNISSMAISATLNRNVVISDNSIQNSRQQAIEGGGINTTICRNKLKNIGWMLNTRAITGGGEQLHICDNVIQDFNYCAIACGSTTANNNASKLTFVIERNNVSYSTEYLEQHLLGLLADGGAIYSGPQCTQGIIRNNVIANYSGIHSNRGIFLDDGAKNLIIYGNVVINTNNSYDIDLRLCENYSRDIPDHNTGNAVFHNVITGSYRFQDNGVKSNCVGGMNLLLNTDKAKNSDVRLSNKVDDIEIKGGEYKKGKVFVPSASEEMLKKFKLNNYVSTSFEVIK